MDRAITKLGLETGKPTTFPKRSKNIQKDGGQEKMRKSNVPVFV